MQSVVAVVDLRRIRNNAKIFLKTLKKPLIAVVKDDAYGHGGAEVALAVEDLAAGFAVATVDEGAALRTAGIQKSILVLTPPLAKEEALRIAAYGLTASVGSLRTLRLFDFPAEAQIAVNTGMNRYGVSPEELPSLCRAARRRGTQIVGMYSHLYAAEDVKSAGEQTRAFLEARETVRAFYPAAQCHLAATGGGLAGVPTDAVRIGIGLYGYLPSGFEGRVSVRPAMKVYATVADCRRAFGNGAGYLRAERSGALHTVRAGYGDGFFRVGGLGIGNLCMDAYVAEGAARVGKRVLILSDAASYAAEHGTTAYEILVRMRGTVKEYLR